MVLGFKNVTSQTNIFLDDNDLVKYEYLTWLSPQNVKRYVMAVVETTNYSDVVFLHVTGTVLFMEVMFLQVTGGIMFTEGTFCTWGLPHFGRSYNTNMVWSEKIPFSVAKCYEIATLTLVKYAYLPRL